MGTSPMVALASCVDELGFPQPRGRIKSIVFHRTASHRVSDPFFLTIGTVLADKHTAQVYFRTRDHNLAEIQST
jgi:hypothetical protein